GPMDTYSNNLQQNKVHIFDGEGFIVIPGFINAHTHIADSIGKDIYINSEFEERIHPIYGIKQKILKNSKQEHLEYFIRNSAISMLKKGVVAFADFREGGVEGIKLLLNSLSDLPIKSIILGRLEYYFDLKEYQTTKILQYNKKKLNDQKIPSELLTSVMNVLELGDGLGISGANENTNLALKQYRYVFNQFNKHKFLKNKSQKKIIAIHAAESKKTFAFSKKYTGKTEVERSIIFLKPSLFIHMTHATLNDLALVAKNNIGIVICPRSNGILGNGIPDILSMLKLGCKIAIGTDNIMVNSPDLLREVDYIWKVSRSQQSKYSVQNDMKELLKMITVNPGDLFNLNSGAIVKGKFADLLFIDKFNLELQPIHNIYASLIHRLTYDAIKAVMINGKFVNVY
ncbi:MAG: amidohydrolase family protein, partial [Nitrososphaeraceae archaeon]|nr:amidohydrolase family protein [Nitrososphaeraceae archaeon]